MDMREYPEPTLKGWFRVFFILRVYTDGQNVEVSKAFVNNLIPKISFKYEENFTRLAILTCLSASYSLILIAFCAIIGISTN